MRYLIMGEIVRDGQGARVLGSGAEGTLRVPRALLKQAEGVVSVRVYGLNALGKLYQLDRVVSVKH
jgi:hypothetical protein